MAVFRHERQSAWLEGLERTFQHFAGVPEEVLLDHAKALVIYHNAATREVLFNERFRAFAAYWGFRARPSAPYRARTKGKDERAVGYVKRNALAGREFASWEALRKRILPGGCARWPSVAVHGTLGEQPRERLARAEAAALHPLNGRVPFQAIREVVRRVHSDACVEVATNRYRVRFSPDRPRSHRPGGRGASADLLWHRGGGLPPALPGTTPTAGGAPATCGHYRGSSVRTDHAATRARAQARARYSLRPLCEYEAVVGGGW